ETPAARYRKAPATRWSVRRQPWQADYPASRDESSSASALRSIVKKPIKALEAEGWTKKLDGGWVPARRLSSLQPPASSLQPPASSLYRFSPLIRVSRSMCTRRLSALSTRKRKPSISVISLRLGKWPKVLIT